jgi:peptidoglycan-N-acetylglucosamine deacetylase
VIGNLQFLLSNRNIICVFCVGIVSYFSGCNSNSELKPGICVSFDDRTIREWKELSPLFDRYGAKVTFFVTQFDSLDEEEISILEELKAKGHEIGSHGAMHVISEHYIQEHGYRKYLENEIDQSVSSMEKQGLKPTSFAYPYGAKYWFTDYLLLKRFKVVRGVAVMPTNADIATVDDIYLSRRDNDVSALGFDHGMNLKPDDLKRAFDRACVNNEVVMLYGHSPSSDSSDAYTFDLKFLEEMLRMGQERKLRYYLVSELSE